MIIKIGFVFLDNEEQDKSMKMCCLLCQHIQADIFHRINTILIDLIDIHIDTLYSIKIDITLE